MNPTNPLKIKATFLGTGTSTGVPVVACDCVVCTSPDEKDKRLRASIMIEVNNTVIIIDCGPDFRYQMIKANVQNIDAILFTHEHRDHVGGIDDVRGFNYVWNKKIDIYASEHVINAIKKDFSYIFTETRFFGAPQLEIHIIDENPFTIKDIPITPIKVLHHKAEIFGYRIGDFTYITDASFISNEERQKIKGSKVLVINALRNSKHLSHFSLQQAIEIIHELKPERAFITHMSHFIGLHEEINARLPQHIKLAYDGLIVEI